MTIAVLLLPKLAGIALIVARPSTWPSWGGLATFLRSALVEVCLSATIAPVMMIQHTISLARTLAGVDAGWQPQRRTAGIVSLRVLARFHCGETVLGAGLCAAMAQGLVPLWLAPIAVSLVLAVPVSAMTARVTRRQRSRLFTVPERTRPPEVIAAAETHSQAISRAAAAPAQPAAGLPAGPTVMAAALAAPAARWRGGPLSSDRASPAAFADTR